MNWKVALHYGTMHGMACCVQHKILKTLPILENVVCHLAIHAYRKLPYCAKHTHHWTYCKYYKRIVNTTQPRIHHNRESERDADQVREREMTAVDEGARHSDRRIQRKRQTSILDFPIKCLICSLIPLLQKCICSDLQQLGYDMSLLMEEKHPCHVFRRCYKCGNGPSLLLIIKPKAGRAGDGDGYF